MKACAWVLGTMVGMFVYLVSLWVMGIGLAICLTLGLVGFLIDISTNGLLRSNQ